MVSIVIDIMLFHYLLCHLLPLLPYFYIETRMEIPITPTSIKHLPTSFSPAAISSLDTSTVSPSTFITEGK